VKDIIPIQKINGMKTVNSEDLRKFLEVKTRHNDWIKRKIETLFLTEGEDYLVLKTEYQLPSGKKHKTEYHLTQRAAEHIGMAESSEVGTKIRDAFIAARDEARSKRKTLRQQLYGAHTERSILMRNLETKEWSRLGAEGRDFGILTRKEYDLLGFDKETTKGDMTEDEILLLIASNALNIRACKRVEKKVFRSGIETIMENTAKAIGQAGKTILGVTA
jgi:phage anti-repressor protein